jgi:hypothetical protein
MVARAALAFILVAATAKAAISPTANVLPAISATPTLTPVPLSAIDALSEAPKLMLFAPLSKSSSISGTAAVSGLGHLSGTAAVSATAVATGTPVMIPITETAPNFEPNDPTEDFFVVSIISLPFTALWTLVGATIVASISQRTFPPSFSEGTLISSGAIAFGSSIGIGLLSATWGKGKSAPESVAAPAPLQPLVLPSPSASPNSFKSLSPSTQ